MSSSIKMHPHHPMEQLFARFAKKHIASPVIRYLFLKATFLWGKVFGIAQPEAQVARDFSQGKDGFDHSSWIFKTLYYPEISASFIMSDTQEKDPVKKAAQLIYGTLRFREKLLKGELDDETEVGKPLDMGRYHHFYSRVSLSQLTEDGITHCITDFNPSDFILVAVDGYFYELKVFASDKLNDYVTIHRNLRSLVEDSRQRGASVDEPKAPIGMLTCFRSKKSVRMIDKLLARNEESFNKLNSGLFSVSLDLDEHPQSLDQNLRTIHSKNFHNRDHRRSLQIVVAGNGKAGIVVNPHAGIGGSLSARLVSELYRTSEDLFHVTIPARERSHSKDGAYSPVLFDVTPLKSSNKDLRKIKARIEEQLYYEDQRSTFSITGVGKQHFRPKRVSSDGAFHCALHLAYFRHYGQKPVVGNFINLRNVKYGDIWRYNCTSPQMDEFVGNPTTETFKQAILAHKNLIKEHKKADDEFYLGARYLLRMINLRQLSFKSFPALMLIMNLFVRDFMRKFMSPNIWVSHIPELEGMEMTGRASAQLSYISKSALAGHYMIFDDHINVCLLGSAAKKKEYLPEEEFVAELKKCLFEVKDIVQQI